MNVQEFVADTLVQIASAVNDANTRLAEAKTQVLANPSGGSENSSYGSTPVKVSDIQMIRFDIAVTAESGTLTKGNAGVGIAVLKLNTLGESSKSHANVSRIEFQIPLRLPRVSKERHRQVSVE